MDFFDRFRQYSKVQHVLQDGAPVLLAVSGGVDSVVMLHLFEAAGVAFGVAHCNFKLRGEASDMDELFVRDLAEKFQAPFFSERFDTKNYATENGISTQMAARDLRYAWFEEIAKQHGYQRLATAHNLNDSVETALLNFIRGAGLAGIIGMRNAEFGVRNDDVEHLDIGAQDSEPDIPHSALRIPHSALRIPHSIWRPLLFATRDEIMEYAHANQISWREDSSNASDDYSRNFLRHHIVPKMQELNPNFLHTAERNLYRLQETQENLAFLSRQFLGIEPAAGDLEGFSIDKQKLTQLPAPRQVLYDLLNPFGFTLEQARQIADNLNKTGFLIHSDAGWALLCDRNALLVAPPGGDDQASTLGIQKDDLMLRLEDGSALFFMATSPAKPYPDGIQAILVDAAKIQYPLKLRHWQKGDVFQPFGMGGQRQKLQNFFTHQKRSLFEKRDVWLLLNGDGAIIWIIGLRLDERFQIRENTLSALKITWSKP